MREKCGDHSPDCVEGSSQHQAKTWTHTKNTCKHDYVLPFLVILVCPSATDLPSDK